MILIITILSLLLIISMVMAAIDNDPVYFIGTALILLSAIIFCTYVFAYKEGQVDALSKKKIAYELRKQQDASIG